MRCHALLVLLYGTFYKKASTTAVAAANAPSDHCERAAPAPELFPASKSSGALPQLMRTLSCSYTGFILSMISVRVVLVLKLGVKRVLVKTLGLPPGVLTVSVLLPASHVAPWGGLAAACSMTHAGQWAKGTLLDSCVQEGNCSLYIIGTDPEHQRFQRQ
jgi:hypothetical protein